MKDQPAYILMTTEATCTDEEARKHLLEYIDGTLSIVQAAAFEDHLLECLACEADVSNWKTIVMAKPRLPKRSPKPRRK
jgi:anti-sigma factor RsiW